MLRKSLIFEGVLAAHLWGCQNLRNLFLWPLKLFIITQSTLTELTTLQTINIVRFNVSNNGFTEFNVHIHWKFVHKNVIACRRFKSPFYRQSPYMATPFFIFFLKPHFWHFFDDIAPNEIQDKDKNKLMRENYFFMFRRFQNDVTCFLVRKTFKSNTRLRFNSK